MQSLTPLYDTSIRQKNVKEKARSRQSPSTAKNPDMFILDKARAQVTSGRNRISIPTLLPTYVSISQENWYQDALRLVNPGETEFQFQPSYLQMKVD